VNLFVLSYFNAHLISKIKVFILASPVLAPLKSTEVSKTH